MSHVEFTDTNGSRWVGDPAVEALTASQREELAEMLSNFTHLTFLSLEVAGAKHYFNPSHIVAVSFHEED